jgi:glycogen debranching enzyme
MSNASAGPLNAGEPVAVGSVGQVMTLVEGSTFCLSDRSGDVIPGGAQGLFVRDARLLSRWELRLDGQPALPLSVLAAEAFTARFVLRRMPLPGLADSTLLLVRERLVGDGMRETLTLRNLGRESTSAVLTLHVDGDFSDLFAVKEGRGNLGGAHSVVSGQDLVLTSRTDAGRGVQISASGEPLTMPGALSWQVVVPPHDQWSAEVFVEPRFAGRRLQPNFERGELVHSTAAARKLRAWRTASASVSADSPVLSSVLRHTATDLGALQMYDGTDDERSFVAAGAPWYMTLFGRDSLLTAWMVLPIDLNLAVGTLQTLASVQGTKVDPVTDEEPGRILHELRVGPDRDRALGGSHYYGTVDASPLFVMLLAECHRWGVPEETIRELLPAADAALDWIDRYGDRDGDGFVEYQRATDRGLANQGWKDSFDAINFSSGSLAETPLALCEVQAYVYAAFLARAALAESFGDLDTAKRHRERADVLREEFHRRFWLPQGWYAVALDGRKQPVDSLTSNVAHCLWTGIASDEHAAQLVEHLGSADMDSGYGLRTLSARSGAYNPMSYHNGSVWPHDTAIAVAGLYRYSHVPGAVELAQRLTSGLLDAANAFGGRLPELFCGFGRDEFSPPVPYPTSCSPQAWASATPLLLVRSALGLHPDVPRRTLALRPWLPDSWGRLRLSELRLGSTTLQVVARGDRVELNGLPDDWTHLPAD